MKKKIVSGLLAMATVMSMSGFMIPAQAADGGALEVWVRNTYYDEMVEASKDRNSGKCYRTVEYVR